MNDEDVLDQLIAIADDKVKHLTPLLQEAHAAWKSSEQVYDAVLARYNPAVKHLNHMRLQKMHEETQREAVCLGMQQ